jgi:hypothetical protein
MLIPSNFKIIENEKADTIANVAASTTTTNTINKVKKIYQPLS